MSGIAGRKEPVVAKQALSLRVAPSLTLYKPEVLKIIFLLPSICLAGQ